ncbi:MAG: CUAEP/CCAEP-tail radical SAM (seleno)protein [Burkholderiales bacterium]
MENPLPAKDFKAVLINPYELGRQPFALAQLAAWLKRDGCAVACLDLSLQKLDAALLGAASLVAVYLGMHTATRIALHALPRIRALAPRATLCAYGLYAPMNEALLRASGVGYVFGGECEPRMVELARRLREQRESPQLRAEIDLGKIAFVDPDRSGLPDIARYAHLILADGENKTVGFVEGSRGCKHLCRHCPVVPIYQGRFRIVPLDVVMSDVRQQVAAGAAHISFGDPDFFNGPGHALRLVEALHAEFPLLSYDATIKVQHLIEHAELLPVLRATGCLFITSAVEAVDDQILSHLAKNHVCADFERVVGLLRDAGIHFAPTFVAFTPWTTLEGYVALLQKLVQLHLVESVPPVQLSIRLLLPQGSHLLQLPGFTELIGEFDPAILGYPWRNPDPRVDVLQQQVQACVARGAQLPRCTVFEEVWRAAHAALGVSAPALDANNFGTTIPRLSEPWYCCAEPTDQQLECF